MSLEESHDILDDYEIPKKRSKSYRDLILWWERRRLRYNKVVGGFGCFAFLLIMLNVPIAATAKGLWMFLMVGGLYASIGNVCYCAGWGLDIILKYFSQIYIEERQKVILFWIGTVFSMLPILGLLGLAAIA